MKSCHAATGLQQQQTLKATRTGQPCRSRTGPGLGRQYRTLTLLCLIIVCQLLPGVGWTGPSRTITAPNDLGFDVDDFHIEFDRPVTIRASECEVVPPGVRGNKDFERVRSSDGGRSHHFYSGTVGGDTDPDTEPGRLKIRVESNDGTSPRVVRWWWTIGGNAFGDGNRMGLIHSGEEGGLEVAFEGSSAQGDGRVAVSVGERSALFVPTAQASRQASAQEFLTFLSEFHDSGEPLIDASLSADGQTVNLAGNVLGNAAFQVRVNLLQADSTQPIRLHEQARFQPGDLDRDGRIGIQEVTAVGAQWRAGRFQDIDAVSRAAALWRAGESYSFDAQASAQLRYSAKAPVRRSDARLIYPSAIPVAIQLTGPEAKVWREDHDGDGKDDHTFIDEDGDGNPDRVLVDANGDGNTERQHIDQDDDGDWDTTVGDVDEDGRWDGGKSDTDRDGYYDNEWKDAKDDSGQGNGKPDRGETQPIDPEPVPTGPRPLSSPGPDRDFLAMNRVDVDRDNDGQVDEWWLDLDGDGDWEATGWDDNHDGKVDRIRWDHDGDGKYDHEWKDTGDGTPQGDEITPIEPVVPGVPRPGAG